MSRTYSVELQIQAALGGQFASIMRSAQDKLKNLGDEAARAAARASSKQYRALEQYNNGLAKTQAQIGKYKALLQSAGQTGLKSIKAQADNSALKRSHAENIKQLEEMQAAYDRLKQVRRENKGSMSSEQYRAMGEQLKQARAELKNQQQVVSQSRGKLNTSNAEVNRLNAQLQRQRDELRQLQASLGQAGVSTSQLASHEARLRAEIERTNQSLRQQEQAAAARGRASEASQNLSNAYGNFQGSIDTAKSIMSPFTNAIEDAKTFEKKLSELKSISQMDFLRSGDVEKANQNMALLKAQAKELGRTTTKTSNEVVDAQIYMSRTGMETNDILKVTPNLLKLATSQNMDFGQAADIATNIMMAFGHSTKDLAHDANVLAYASTHSNSNLQQIGESMKYAAPVAKQFGSSIEETAAMLGFMHDAGIQGSMAGTSLRQTMLRLTAPPKKATKAMEENGITVADCAKEWQMAQDVAKQYGVALDGNLKPGQQMASVIEQIDKNMAGLSSQEKMAAFSAITGVNAVSGAMNVFDKGAAALKKQTEALRNSDGTLDIMYDTATDNTWGAEAGFDSARDALSKSVGDVFLPGVERSYKALTQLTQGLDEFVNKHQTAVQYAGLLAAALGTITVVASGAALAMSAFGFISAAVGAIVASPFVMAVGAVIAFGTAIYAVISIIGAVIDAIPQMAQALSNAWNDPQGAIHGFTSLAKSLIEDAVNYIMNRWETMKSALEHPIDAIINVIDHGDVIGGNVRSGESIRQQSEAHQAISTSVSSGSGGLGAINQQISQIDTSQTQQGVNELGNASNAAAQSTNNLAQTVEQNSQATSNLQNAITGIEGGVTNLQNSFTSVNDGVTNLNTGLTSTNEGFTAVQQNAQLTSTELTNLTTNAQAVSPALQQVTQAASSTAPPLQQVGSAASSASSGLSQISSAAGSVASALSAKAAQISSISISAPKVASNAAGGIYKQGAFLTTFAEKSPEAAIPLDNSQRAKDLWTKAGQALGTLPGSPPKAESPNSSVAEKIYQKRVEEVKKRAERQKAIPTPVNPSTPIAEKNPVSAKNPAPENANAKLTAEERQILQQAAIEYQSTGRANLPEPTEKSSAEYRRRYENNKKLQEAMKNLPVQKIPQTSTVSKQSQGVSSARQGTIFSTRRKSPSPNLPMTQTKSRNFDTGLGGIFSGKTQNKIPTIKNLPTSPNFNPTMNKIPSLEKIFSGGMKLPNLPKSTGLGGIFGNIGKIFGSGDKVAGKNINLPKIPATSSFKNNPPNAGIVGGILENLPSIAEPPEKNSDNLPPINISITIQGNADANTMQQAGQVLAVDLKKELDSWWRDKKSDEQRRSFV